MCSAESVGFGLPPTDENSPGIPDQAGERPTPLSKLSFDEDATDVGFDDEVGKGGLESPEAKMQKSEARIAGHWRWLESTGVSAYVKVHIDSCRRSLYEDPKIQRSEAERRDVPRCDDRLPGPTIGRLHGEAGCGHGDPSGHMQAN